jgi:hypothetical protein
MKGIRHTTEGKIPILRNADGGKNINEVCKDRNISSLSGAAVARRGNRRAGSLPSFDPQRSYHAFWHPSFRSFSDPLQ